MSAQTPVQWTRGAQRATESVKIDTTTAPNDAWIEQARALTSDLMARSMPLYWLDLLLSAGAAWALTAVYFTAPHWSLIQIAAFLGASVLFFRAGTFIHEIVHMQRDQARWFGRAWNLLLGIPLMMPWIMYRNHVDHHSQRLFGTPRDGEYLPLASSSIGEFYKYLLQVPLLPLFAVVRFGILGPVSYLNPRLRNWVLCRASAAVSNPHYNKRFPARDERHLQIVEWICFAWIVCLGTLIARSTISWTQVGMAYLLIAWSLGLNWVRNLAAHRYANHGDSMSQTDQVLDSINVTGKSPLTMLMFPVGLRYHALHHLLPTMPYHNMGEAHRRLMQQLPSDSPYRQTNEVSFFAAVSQLWQGARTTSPENSAVRAWTQSQEPSRS